MVRFGLDAFGVLYDDVDEAFLTKPSTLQLAHYTSLQVLESILKNEEIWLSNPLLMNDLTEVRLGLLEGAEAVRANADIRAAFNNDVLYERFIGCFDSCLAQFDSKFLLDTYIFCLCEHKKDDDDGLLSMWRGYGSNGNGAAIVFDLGKLNFVDGSPLIIGKVHYKTPQDRQAWLAKKLKQFAEIIKDLPRTKEELFAACYGLFRRIQLAALFSKHHGFIEEQEWRVVYLSDHDKTGLMKPMLGYFNGPRGVEPKLKLKLSQLPGAMAAGNDLDSLVSKIILGPSLNNALSFRSIERMLNLIDRGNLVPRLRACSIPYRAL